MIFSSFHLLCGGFQFYSSLSSSPSNLFHSIVSTAIPSLLPPTCGNYYGEFGRGMYVLNLNRRLKVEDLWSPLSCNAAKVSFQIKKGLFDLPNIVFSPFRGWKWLVLSLISLPSLSSLTYTVQTHMVGVFYGACCGVVRVQCRGARTQNNGVQTEGINSDAYK